MNSPEIDATQTASRTGRELPKRELAHGQASTQENQDPCSNYCPVCSVRLESHRCKLRCQVCGYYMSCSDYI